MQKPKSMGDQSFETEYDKVWNTLKIRWQIAEFRDLDFTTICSPEFQSPDDPAHEFWLELTFVSGISENSQSNVSAVTSDSNQQTVACLHIRRRKNGEIRLKYLIGLGGPTGTMKVLTQDGCFSSQKVRFGGSLIQRTKILHPSASYLTPDGSLIVYAEVRVMRPEQDMDQWTRDRTFVLMRDKHFTDMSIVSNGVVVRSHRLLVGSSSPLFFQQLQQLEAGAQESVIKLEEDLSVINHWLTFLTSGSVDSVTEDDAFKLLHFSHTHQVPSLWSATQSHLAANLTTSNVIRVTRNAYLHNCTSLLHHCLDFIGKHVTDVSDWDQLFDDATSRSLFHMVFKVLRPE